jgi:hypothetical protein
METKKYLFETLWKQFLTEGTVRIGNLEVYDAPLPQKMTWDQATAAVQALGEGWRLATDEEFVKIINRNMDKLTNLPRGIYWAIGEKSQRGEPVGQMITNDSSTSNLYGATMGKNQKIYVLPVKG